MGLRLLAWRVHLTARMACLPLVNETFQSPCTLCERPIDRFLVNDIHDLPVFVAYIALTEHEPHLLYHIRMRLVSMECAVR